MYLQFWRENGLNWCGFQPTEKIQTLPEDGSTTAGLRTTPESKFMKRKLFHLPKM